MELEQYEFIILNRGFNSEFPVGFPMKAGEDNCRNVVITITEMEMKYSSYVNIVNNYHFCRLLLLESQQFQPIGNDIRLSDLER